MLDLDRPLVVLDLEATGTDPASARIIQVAAFRFEPGSSEEPAETMVTVVDPGEPVPPQVLNLTGITPDQIADAQRWPFVAGRLGELIADADLAGYNLRKYDLPLLEAEYDRMGEVLPGPPGRQVVDAYELERALRPRTLENVYQEYTGDALEDAHDAAADAQATWTLLQRQAKEHGLEGSSAADLSKAARGDFLDGGRKLKQTEQGVVVCFGKHKGKTLTELQDEAPGYLQWMYGEITELQGHIDAALGENALGDEAPREGP